MKGVGGGKDQRMNKYGQYELSWTIMNYYELSVQQ